MVLVLLALVVAVVVVMVAVVVVVVVVVAEKQFRWRMSRRADQPAGGHRVGNTTALYSARALMLVSRFHALGLGGNNNCCAKVISIMIIVLLIVSLNGRDC